MTQRIRPDGLRQVGEKRVGFGRVHLCGMALLMEQEEAFDPLNVGLFGAVGIVLAADSIGNLAEQFTGAFAHFWSP
jgi:hypothetical protein